MDGVGFTGHIVAVVVSVQGSARGVEDGGGFQVAKIAVGSGAVVVDVGYRLHGGPARGRGPTLQGDGGQIAGVGIAGRQVGVQVGFGDGGGAVGAQDFGGGAVGVAEHGGEIAAGVGFAQ